MVEIIDSTFTDELIAASEGKSVTSKYFTFENILSVPYLFSKEEFEVMNVLLRAEHSLTSWRVYFLANKNVLETTIASHINYLWFIQDSCGDEKTKQQYANKAEKVLDFLNLVNGIGTGSDKESEEILKKIRKTKIESINLKVISYNRVKRILKRLSKKGFVNFDMKGRSIEWYIEPAFRDLCIFGREKLLKILGEDSKEYARLSRSVMFLSSDIKKANQEQQVRNEQKFLEKERFSVLRKGLQPAQTRFFLYNTPYENLFHWSGNINLTIPNNNR